MKNTISAVVLGVALVAGPVSAGNLADPVVEAPVIVEDVTNSSSANASALVAFLTVLMTIPALAN